jgi:hypothetical protein
VIQLMLPGCRAARRARTVIAVTGGAVSIASVLALAAPPAIAHTAPAPPTTTTTAAGVATPPDPPQAAQDQAPQVLGPMAKVKLCKPYASAVERSIYTAMVIVRNDSWGQPGCITTQNSGRANLTVDTKYNWTGIVKAYPSVFRGCEYGRCSPDSPFPVKVSKALSRKPAPAAVFRTSGPKSGTANGSLDMWFGTTSNTAKHATGAEVMIWPWRSGACCSLHGGRKVKLAGRTWYILHWRACQRGTDNKVCWNYVQFRAYHSVTGFKWLALAPFLKQAEKIGSLRGSWYWWNVFGGFEIWSGGQNLAVNSFWARP